MTKVAFVDDHVIVLEPLSDHINTFEGFHVTIRAVNGEELIKAIEKVGPPDILILDMDMPVMNGFETAVWMHEHHPQVKILVLTMHSSNRNMVAAMVGAGVRGLLSKDIHPNELQVALLRMRDTDCYYFGKDDEQMRKLVQRIIAEKDAFKKDLLDSRELQYLRLICSGLTNQKACERMCIGDRTGESIKESIMTKLKVNNNMELAFYAFKNGLLHLR